MKKLTHVALALAVIGGAVTVVTVSSTPVIANCNGGDSAC